MDWLKELKRNITTLEELKAYLPLDPEEEAALRRVLNLHPMSIPRYYLSLINPEDPEDPIRKMAVPAAQELVAEGEYDTSGEHENTKLPGLQHKYAQTALILATTRCAMYCRYCFRKRLVGLKSQEVIRRLEAAAEYIRQHPEINNVLISGGDPLTLPNDLLEQFLKTLTPIPHLRFVRIGSRVPVTFPFRILWDDELISLFRRYSRPEKRLFVVTHFNHPREITPESTEAVARLVDAGVIVSNQTVLLRGVNDDPEVLADLQNRLVSIGVNPYYVFQCRPVKRVKHHFQVPLLEGYHIVEEAKKRLNGHSKRFRYAMSHRTGKVEILGVVGDYFVFKYHQAKDPANYGKIFFRRVNPTAGWLDDLEPVDEEEVLASGCLTA